MMVRPSVTDLLKKVDNRFELVVATAKRARQLSKGEKALVDMEEESTVTLAADEIAEGKVRIVDGLEEASKIQEDKENEEDIIEDIQNNSFDNV